MTYYGQTTTLRDALIGVVENITWLSGRVHKNTWNHNQDFPQAYVVLYDDDVELESVTRGTYYINPRYNIVFMNETTGTPETDKDIVTSGIGAIFDQIRGTTTNYSGSVAWEKAEIESFNHNYISPGATPAVVKEASMNVRVTKRIPG